MRKKIACLQMTSTQSLATNLQAAEKLIQSAAAEEAGLVVLPEMFATMGMDQALTYHEAPGHGEIQDFLRRMAKHYSVWIVGGTIPLATNASPRVRAACLVLDDQGNQVARYDKIHLFDVQIRASQEAYQESQRIEPGDSVVVVPTPWGRLDLDVCYDIRFPELFRQMQDQQVEIVAIPAAFTYATGLQHWEILVKARAIENLMYVVTACQTGNHSNGRRTFGHSMIVNPWGTTIDVLPEKEGVVSAEIDLTYLQQVRAEFPALTHCKL